VALRRTTRERFPRRLVFAMKVEKKTFDQEALIDFTRDFATTQDFDIQPIAFIQGFNQNGILHFHNGNVRFSLAFIEAYLLAAKLADNPTAAAAYFDPAADDFDGAAFDLYAEIRPDRAVTERIVKAVADAIGVNALSPDAPHILLTNDLNPALLRDSAVLAALQKNLASAADDVRSGLRATTANGSSSTSTTVYATQASRACEAPVTAGAQRRRAAPRSPGSWRRPCERL
jgi:hypothetical protein